MSDDAVQTLSDVNRDRLLQTFLDLVATDSPTDHQEEIGHVLERLFGEAGCRVSRGEIGNVVAVYPGDGNFFDAKGIPCVGLATGMVDEHATTEHIAIDDMVSACRILPAIVTVEA